MRKAWILMLAALVLSAGSVAWAQPTTGEPSGQTPPAVQPPPAGQIPPAGEQKPGEQKPGEQKPAEQKPQGGFEQMLPMVILLGGFFLLYMWMGRSRRKESKKREVMLGGLQKGDHITTIGGIMGTVLDVREDEVTVKIDEATNTKMRFARWAIRGVGEAGKAEGPDKKA